MKGVKRSVDILNSQLDTQEHQLIIERTENLGGKTSSSSITNLHFCLTRHKIHRNPSLTEKEGYEHIEVLSHDSYFPPESFCISKMASIAGSQSFIIFPLFST